MQEESSVILTKKLLQELYTNNTTTSLKESSKKVRYSALNKLPDNFSVNILNETETMMKVKELNLSNTYKSILWKSIALWVLLNGNAGERTQGHTCGSRCVHTCFTKRLYELYKSLGTKDSRVLDNPKKNYPQFSKDTLTNIAKNDKYNLIIRILLSLFIDIPLRSGDFECILKVNKKEEILLTPGVIYIYKNKIYNVGVKDSKKTITKVSARTNNLLKMVGNEIKFNSRYSYNKFVESNFFEIFSDLCKPGEMVPKSFSALRHCVLNWAEPENMHHSILTHYEY